MSCACEQSCIAPEHRPASFPSNSTPVGAPAAWHWPSSHQLSLSSPSHPTHLDVLVLRLHALDVLVQCRQEIVPAPQEGWRHAAHLACATSKRLEASDARLLDAHAVECVVNHCKAASGMDQRSCFLSAPDLPTSRTCRMCQHVGPEQQVAHAQQQLHRACSGGGRGRRIRRHACRELHQKHLLKASPSVAQQASCNRSASTPPTCSQPHTLLTNAVTP